MTPRRPPHRRVIAMILALLIGPAIHAYAQKQERVTVYYSIDQLREPYFDSLLAVMDPCLRRCWGRQYRSVAAMINGGATDGSEVYVAFVQYVGDEVERQALKRLVPVAYLGEGFAVFGKTGEPAVGWWGLFLPPGTSASVAAAWEKEAVKTVKGGTIKRALGRQKRLFKLRELPMAEFRQPPGRASLVAALDAPPGTPTPTALAAARARLAQLQAEPDYASARRDRVEGASDARDTDPAGGIATLLGSVQRMGLSGGATGLTQALPGTANTTQALAQALQSNPQVAQALAQALQSNPAVAQALTSLLQPPAVAGQPNAGLSSLLPSAQPGTGQPNAALSPLLQALGTTNSPPASGMAPLLQALQGANGSTNGALTPLLQALGVGAAPAGGLPSSLTAAPGAVASPGSSASGIGAGFDMNAAIADLDRAGAAEPSALACVTAMKATLARFKPAFDAIPSDQVVWQLETLMWLDAEGMRIVKTSCSTSPTFTARAAGTQQHYEQVRTTCSQISSTGSCQDREPGTR